MSRPLLDMIYSSLFHLSKQFLSQNGSPSFVFFCLVFLFSIVFFTPLLFLFNKNLHSCRVSVWLVVVLEVCVRRRVRSSIARQTIHILAICHFEMKESFYGKTKEPCALPENKTKETITNITDNMIGFSWITHAQRI